METGQPPVVYDLNSYLEDATSDAGGGGFPWDSNDDVTLLLSVFVAFLAYTFIFSPMKETKGWCQSMISLKLLMLCFLIFHSSCSWGVSNFPNPIEHPGACNVEWGTAACDPDRLISKRGHKLIRRALAGIDRDTRRQCEGGVHAGFHVNIAIVREVKLFSSIRFISYKQKLVAAKEFAVQIGDKWKYGNERCTNNILLFVSKQDKIAYIRSSTSATALPEYIHLSLSNRFSMMFTSQEDFEEGLLECVGLLHTMMKDAPRVHNLGLKQQESASDEEATAAADQKDEETSAAQRRRPFHEDDDNFDDENETRSHATIQPHSSQHHMATSQRSPPLQAGGDGSSQASYEEESSSSSGGSRGGGGGGRTKKSAGKVTRRGSDKAKRKRKKHKKRKKKKNPRKKRTSNPGDREVKEGGGSGDRRASLSEADSIAATPRDPMTASGATSHGRGGGGGGENNKRRKPSSINGAKGSGRRRDVYKSILGSISDVPSLLLRVPALLFVVLWNFGCLAWAIFGDRLTYLYKRASGYIGKGDRLGMVVSSYPRRSKTNMHNKLQDNEDDDGAENSSSSRRSSRRRASSNGSSSSSSSIEEKEDF